MAKYKNKYLRVNEKGRFGIMVCRVDVSHLNKRGINAEWDRLEEKYPKDNFISCLESTYDELPCFEKQTESKTESNKVH